MAASQCFLAANPTNKVVVISPASLIGNFEKEMIKYGGKLSAQYSFYSFTKFSSLNKGAFVTPFDIYYRENHASTKKIYNKIYGEMDEDELLHKMNKDFTVIKKTKPPPPPEKSKYQIYKEKADLINVQQRYDCKNTMVIIDEAHNVRNMGTKYKTELLCVMQSKKLLLLTATPFVNRLHDFVPLINMLYRDPDILKKENKRIPVEINQDKYELYLEHIYDMLQGKVTFLNDKDPNFFPKVIRHKKEINMSMEYYKKYEKALTVDREYGDAPEVFYNGFRRAVNKIGIDEYINEKLETILKIIDNGEQTLVFTNWLESGVEILEKEFEKNDITYMVISGEVLASTRLGIVEKFNNKKVQVLLITLAGSEGLDLKEVRNVIILDPVWNGSVMEQIIGRAVRYKSHIKLPVPERRVDVYNLILKAPLYSETPSGDQILYDIIYRKNKQLQDIESVLKAASI